MPKFSKFPNNAEEVSFLIPYYRSLPIYSLLNELNQNFSMLHPDVLALLYHFASYTTNPILEIGPYTGGSAVAISLGIKAAGSSSRFVSIEKGGAHDHASYGSTDIIADFHRHIKEYEVEGYPQLIEGYSRDPRIVSEVKSAFGNEKLGLLFVDADGMIQKDLQTYADLLQKNTYLIIDDYFSADETLGNESASTKMSFTKDVLDQMQARNEVQCLGVYGWGTWVGRVR